MKYLLFIFFAICLMSCHDLHQKLYDTFHETKHNVTKDSTAKKDSVVTFSKFQLTHEEAKDDSNTGATTWQNAGIEDVFGFKTFLKKLQQWSEQNNKDSIAANIQYPLLNDKKISTPTIFLQQYEKVFNQKVKQALKEQDFRRIFRNYHGVMIGNGEIWISNISETDNENYKITSINYR